MRGAGTVPAAQRTAASRNAIPVEFRLCAVNSSRKMPTRRAGALKVVVQTIVAPVSYENRTHFVLSEVNRATFAAPAPGLPQVIARAVLRTTGDPVRPAASGWVVFAIVSWVCPVWTPCSVVGAP